MTAALLVTGRNLRLYFRDRAAVFFSLLAPLILLGLYAFFLGGVQVDALEADFPTTSREDAQAFVDSWAMAGIVMITTLTTSLAALGAFVDDIDTGRFKDFIVAPVGRGPLVLGYILAAFIVSSVMSVIVTVVGQIYFLIQGYPLLSPMRAVELLGYVLLSSAAFAALSSLAVSFVKSSSAFSGLSTLVGTLTGFLAGAYVPQGILPTGVANAMNALPFAQSAMLIRGPLTEVPLESLSDGNSDVKEFLEHLYGITGAVGSFEITPLIACATLVLTFLISIVLGTMLISRKIR